MRNSTEKIQSMAKVLISIAILLMVVLIFIRRPTELQSEAEQPAESTMIAVNTDRMNSKIVIEALPNEQVRIYHLRTDLSEQVVQRIFYIRGVISKFSHHSRYDKETYSLTIHKGKAFDWGEIQLAVLEILIEFFTQPNIPEEQPTTPKEEPITQSKGGQIDWIYNFVASVMPRVNWLG